MGDDVHGERQDSLFLPVADSHIRFSTMTRWSRSTPAAIATLLAGLFTGGLGFIRFARQAASDNNLLMLEVARRQADGTMGGAEISTAAPVAMTALAPLAFVVGTPLGWLAAYLVITGFVRSISAVVREPLGDPLSAGIALSWRRLLTRRAETRAAAAREALEGPEVADRLASAGRMGIGDAELVVVASRPKHDWTPGTILDCGHRFFRVGEPVERTLPGGLRTLYPLSGQPDAGVFRRLVRYDLPVLMADPVER